MLRIGILGAARIAPAALIKPASETDGVEVTAVAARDGAKAQAFATKHGIAHVRTSYAELIADPAIDAIYNPLPNGLHGHWTIEALRAGKHVLCEKPFTANADEAEAVAKVTAECPNQVVMEAFHWRYHPLAAKLRDLIAEGELGEVTGLHTYMCIPLPMRNDIRFNHALAGGSMMDVGCYAVHMHRTFAGGEPTVESAAAKVLRRDAKIDRFTTAEFSYANGISGSMTAALWSGQVLRIGFRAVGTRGELRCFNPTQPGLYHRAVIKGSGAKRNVGVNDKRASYWHQLGAFRDAVGGDASRNLTGTSQAIANMRVIDSVYRAAGMEPRQPSA